MEKTNPKSFKNKSFSILAALGVFFGSYFFAGATSVFNVQQGGTGLLYPTTGFQANSVLIGNGTGPIATTSQSSIGLPFPFTPTSYGVSTTTTLGLLNGFLSNASSTINAPLHLPTLSDGALNVFGGLVSSSATSSTGTAGATAAFNSSGGMTFTGDAVANHGIVVGGISTSALTNNGVIDYLNPNLRFSLPSTESYYWYNQGRGTNLLAFLNGSTGQFQLAKYGAGSITGTPTHSLSVDSSGNIIETGVVSAYPFTPSTNFGAAASATTSQLWLQGAFASSIPSLSASSTSFLSTTTIYTQDADGFRVISSASNHIATFQNTTSGSSHASFCNSVTNCTTSDGTDYGIDPSGNARILNHEASGFRLLVNQSVEAIDALLNGLVGIGTTTPASAQLVVASSTGPQIALTGTGGHIWNMREAGGNLYYATSSPTTYATSTLDFWLDVNGKTNALDVVHNQNGVLSPTHAWDMSIPTTTTWTATSSVPYTATIYSLPFKGKFYQAVCRTDQSFLNVLFKLGSNSLPLIVGVSPTQSTTTFSSSNTFGEGTTLTMDAGTTTTASTLRVDCTTYFVETP